LRGRDILPKTAAIVAILAVVGGAYWSGLLTYADPQRLRTLLLEAGVWGPLLFIALFVIAELVNVPGMLFVVGASLTWPPAMATAVAYTGALSAAVTAFLVARYLAGDVVQRHLPARFHVYDRRLAEKGLWTVIVLRLLFFLAPWVHMALGVSRVRFRDFFIGTAIGITPGVVTVGAFGAAMQRWASQIPLAVWVTLILASVAIVAMRRWRKHRAASDQQRAMSNEQ
jgi:uncharacterized membrane protein YdjX (TVP38/TMEM64 family)